MSRIGQKPIDVPASVQATLEGRRVSVKGPKGELSRTLPADMMVQIGDGVINVTRPTDSKIHRSLHGLTRTLVANMVQGVTEGFEKKLILQGVGYRAEGTSTGANFNLGYSHPVRYDAAEGIQIEAQLLSPEQSRITVRGIDKELVGQTAAEIRRLRKVEPYKGKGIRYINERVRRKAGKAGRIGGVR